MSGGHPKGSTIGLGLAEVEQALKTATGREWKRLSQRAKYLRWRDRRRGLDVPKLTVRLMGEQNPAWRGDKVAKRSARLRAQRLLRDAGPCVRCGAAKAERHHKDHNPWNNDMSNIEVLCRPCHIEEHRACK